MHTVLAYLIQTTNKTIIISYHLKIINKISKTALSNKTYTQLFPIFRMKEI